MTITVNAFGMCLNYSHLPAPDTSSLPNSINDLVDTLATANITNFNFTVLHLSGLWILIC